VTNAATGAFTYTPAANANGLDTFRFKVNDGTVDSNIATVTVVIAPVNDAPVASVGTNSVMSGMSAAGTLSATDVDSPNLTFSLVANGTKGTAVITNAATGAYTYTANGGTSGTDTFTFRANDGSANSSVATVTVSITPSPAPAAQNGALSTVEDTSATGTLVATDPGGLPLTYSIVSSGSKGTATITNAATGQYTYAPAANAYGSDSFTFRASNGTYLSNTATVSVIISAVNDPPVAGNSAISVAAGASVSGVLSVTEVDGDALAFSIMTNGSKGTATIVNASTGTFSYSANAGASGTDTFTFRVNDATVNSNVATVTVTIGSSAPGNSPPVPLPAGGAAASVRFDSIGDELFRTTNLPTITSFTMMGWFRFVGDTNAYSAFLRLGHATSSHGYNLLRCCGGGWRELDLWNGAGIWTVKPTITLGTWYHLAVTVSGSGAGQVKTYVNGALALTSPGNPSATSDRLSIGNDAHEEWLNGNAAAVKIYDAPLTEAEIAAEMNRLTPVRTANLNAWYPLQSGATAGTDFSGNNRTLVQAGTLTTDSAGPPIQAGYTVSKNTSLNGVLQATDADGDPLIFALGTAASHGTISVNANGNFIYTPTNGWTGTDSFTFTVSDGVASASATVSITVVP
jgi:hypothetical protein